ncbi:hypothetical protein Q8F55_004943 [Vanrija albida]|uniref:Uncharacterized protein n=1 Tax=Vanrija albida TaxID=181172 RepID=A0ABR3Q0H2_9TREE
MAALDDDQSRLLPRTDETYPMTELRSAQPEGYESHAMTTGYSRTPTTESNHHDHHDHHAEDKPTARPAYRRRQSTSKRVTRAVRRLPFLRKPTRDLDEVWLAEGDRATTWLPLFYDLVVVAVLGVFSTTHELRTAEAIPIFFSYYVIIVGIWTSQVHYDVRYEAEDTFHRFFKALQIVLFVYIGAASGGWNPGKMIQVTDVAETDEDAIRQLLHDQAAESFLTIVLAFAVNRVILFIQYLVVIWSGRRAGRPTLGPWMSAAACVLSCALSIVAAAVPVKTNGIKYMKLALFYVGIAVEVAGMGLQHLVVNTPVPVVEIAERYGALSLVIIGEGFVGISTSFNKALTAINVTNKSVYAQVFLVILVMVNIWSFLFSNFRPEDAISPNRTTVWELVHFPLHFGMLLLLAGLVNAVIADSFDRGLISLGNYMEPFYNVAVLGDELPAKNMTRMSLFFNRLDSGFLSTVEFIGEMRNETNELNPNTFFYQYCSDLVNSLCQKSGVELGEATKETYNFIQELTITDVTNSSIPLAAEEGFWRMVGEVADDAFSGVRWLFPVAGGVLILCAVRSAIRYNFVGVANPVIHGGWMIAGLALGLLGLLDLGDKRYMLYSGQPKFELIINPNMNPMYKLINSHMAIAVVFLVYTAVTVFTYAFLGIWNRYHSKVFED